jgi:ribosomal protein L9
MWFKKHNASHAMLISKLREMDDRIASLEIKTNMVADSKKENVFNPYGGLGSAHDSITTKDAIYAIKKYLGVRIEKREIHEIVAVKSEV